jgi:hypothetical protein
MKTTKAGEFEVLVVRSTQAEDRFIDFAMSAASLTKAEAVMALAAYRKHKLIKCDSATGQFTVKHGAFLDVVPLRRAAGFDE